MDENELAAAILAEAEDIVWAEFSRVVNEFLAARPTDGPQQ
jgi:hypothetical protein